MARKKKVGPVPVDMEPATAEETAEEPQAEGSGWRYQPTLDAFVTVTRRDEEKQEWVYHGRLPVHESEEEHIAARFGGGRYRLQLRERGLTGGAPIRETRTFTVPGRYRRPETLPGLPTLADAQPPMVSPAVPVGAASEGMSRAAVDAALVSTVVDLLKIGKEVRSDPVQAQVLELLAKQQQKMEERFLMLMERLDRSAAPAPAPPTLQERLEELRMLRDLMAPPPAPPAAVNAMDQAIQIYRTMKELGGEVSGGESDEHPVVAQLPRLVEIIAEEQRQRREAGKAPVTIPPPAIPRPPESPVSSVPLWLQVIRVEGPRLIGAAQVGRDPEFIANLALEFAKPPVVEAIGDFAARPDALEVLLREVPGLQSHEAWARSFVEAVRSMFEEEEPEVIEETKEEPEEAP